MTEVSQTTNEITVSGIDTTVNVSPTSSGPNITVNAGINNIDVTPSPFSSEVNVGLSLGERGYYGAFSDYTDQLPGNYNGAGAVANTPSAFIFSQVDEYNGVYINYNEYAKLTRITVDNSGTYNIQWSGQFQCTDTQDQDVSVWLRKNGTIASGASSDVVGSTGLVAIPSTHGGLNGHTIAGWNFVLTLNAGDYLEFFWSATSTSVSLQHFPVYSTPTRPSTASLVLTVTQVGNILEGGVSGGGGGSGSQGAQGPQGPQGPQGTQGPQGPQGTQGPSGVIAVTAPITNSGTSTSANIGLSIGAGLTTSAGAIVPNFGSTSGTVTQGNDSRLSDARTPTVHKTSHSIGGSDVLSPTDIGAVSKSGDTMTGDLSTTGLVISDTDGTGVIRLASQSSLPSSPSAGNGIIFNTVDVGQSFPAFRGERGNPRLLVQMPIDRRWSMHVPTGQLSGTSAISGTFTRSIINNDYVQWVTAASANSSGIFWMLSPSMNSTNGFFMRARLRWPDASYDNTGASTGTRIWGICTASTQGHPASDRGGTVRSCGFNREHVNGANTDTNWQIVVNNSTGTTVVDTGMAFVANKIYDQWLYQSAGGSNLYWQIDNITDSTTASGSTVAYTATTGSCQPGIRTIDAVARKMDAFWIYIEQDLI